MGRNRKLTGKIKSLEKDDEEKQIINNEPAKVCHNCYWSGVKKILKDAYDDISEKEFVKERKFANQVAEKLLPKQKIKIRFVEFMEDCRKFIIDVIFSRRVLQNQKIFAIALPHELAHASDSVRFHPDYNPDSTIFSRQCFRVQSQKLLTTIENSACGICEKEFTEKDIRENNFILILASRNNKISSANIFLSIKSFRHEKCPRKYRS
ncbi:10480_t:CDS:2 [Gigaspora margarita]|uniref:10480_t:CDS:1 n=1 Tax=Gigaspora margarita TaxID=4874 RepID=A0ABM8VWN4_GIGMA|nr:10480_t:CDS:2 [Gigaspora margarita]